MTEAAGVAANASYHGVLIYDDLDKAAQVAKALHPCMELRLHRVDAIHDLSLDKIAFAVVDVDMWQLRNLRRLRPLLVAAEEAGLSPLFIVDHAPRGGEFAVFAGKAILARPFTDDALNEAVGRCGNRYAEQQWRRLAKREYRALVTSLRTFETMMQDARDCRPIDAAGIAETGRLIVDAILDEALPTWIEALQFHTNGDFCHSLSTCGYLVSFGHGLGLDRGALEQLAVAGFVHDIGKAWIPQAILRKPRRLSDEEFEVVKLHTRFGEEMLNRGEGFRPEVVAAAMYHHERLDGTGYPDGLAEGEIPMIAKITAVADVFSALTERRAYKPALPVDQAYDMLLEMDGHLDMSLVRAFAPVVERCCRLAA